MKNSIYLFIVIIVTVNACSQHEQHADKRISADKAWLDSIIKSSDTTYQKPYFRRDFVTAYYYGNRKDSTLCQVMKDSAETIRQIIITKKDIRTFYARYYANGQLEAQLPLDEMGKYHGEVFNFYENGQLASKGNYTHGLKTGEWKNYDSLGHSTANEQFDESGQFIK